MDRRSRRNGAALFVCRTERVVFIFFFLFFSFRSTAARLCSPISLPLSSLRLRIDNPVNRLRTRVRYVSTHAADIQAGSLGRSGDYR